MSEIIGIITHMVIFKVEIFMKAIPFEYMIPD